MKPIIIDDRWFITGEDDACLNIDLTRTSDGRSQNLTLKVCSRTSCENAIVEHYQYEDVGGQPRCLRHNRLGVQFVAITWSSTGSRVWVWPVGG